MILGTQPVATCVQPHHTCDDIQYNSTPSQGIVKKQHTSVWMLLLFSLCLVFPERNEKAVGTTQNDSKVQVHAAPMTHTGNCAI